MEDKKVDQKGAVCYETSHDSQLVKVRLPILGEVEASAATHEEALRKASFLREMAQDLIKELSGSGPYN